MVYKLNLQLITSHVGLPGGKSIKTVMARLGMKIALY